MLACTRTSFAEYIMDVLRIPLSGQFYHSANEFFYFISFFSFFLSLQSFLIVLLIILCLIFQSFSFCDKSSNLIVRSISIFLMRKNCTYQIRLFLFFQNNLHVAKNVKVAFDILTIHVTYIRVCIRRVYQEGLKVNEVQGI